MTMFLPGGGTIINHRNDYKRYRSTRAPYEPFDYQDPPGGLLGASWACRSTARLREPTPKTLIMVPMDGNRSAPGPQKRPKGRNISVLKNSLG